MIRPDKLGEAELGIAVLQEFRERYAAMGAQHRNWLEYYCFAILSEQYLRAAPMSMEYPFIPTYSEDSGGTRVTMDKVGLHVERIQAALQQRRPRVIAVPRTGEVDDRDAAEMCQDANDYLWHVEKIPKLYRDLGLYVPVFGTAFWMQQWNPDGGVHLRINFQEEMKKGIERGESQEEWDEVIKEAEKKASAGNRSIKKAGHELIFDDKQGLPLELVEMPQSIYFNRGATMKPETWLHVMRASIVPITWFEDHYPGKDVVPMGTSQYESLWMAEGVSSEITSLRPNTKKDKEEQDWALLVEMRFPPRKKLEAGRWVLVGGENGTVLSSEESDFNEEESGVQKGCLGIYPIYWRPDPRSPYGISMVELARPTQEELNEAISIIAEYAGKCGGQLFAPKEAGIHAVQSPVRRLEYSGTLTQDMKGPPIGVLAPPSPSPVILERVRIAIQHLTEIARDPSGALASGLPKTRSAIHAGVLNEMASKGMESLIGDLIELEECTTTGRIELIRQNWPFPVGLRVFGEGSEPQIKTFWSKKIQEGVDFRVMEVPDNLFTRAVHDAKMTQMFQMGVFGDPRVGAPGWRDALQDYLKAMSVPTPSTLLKQTAIARNQAKAETEYMLTTGEEVPVSPLDDHEIHSHTHKEEVNQPKYRNVSEEVKNILVVHWRKHEELRKESLEGQVQRLMNERQQMAEENQKLTQYIGRMEDEKTADTQEKEDLFAMAAEGGQQPVPGEMPEEAGL